MERLKLDRNHPFKESSLIEPTRSLRSEEQHTADQCKKTLNEVISANWSRTCQQINREHLWEIFQNQSLSQSLGM